VANILALLSALILLVAWSLPNHHYPWPAFYNDFPAGLALLFLATSLCIRHGINERITATRTFAVLAVIVIVPLAQWAFGLILFFGDAAITAAYLSGLALAYITGLQFKGADRRRFLLSAALVFVCGAVVSLFLALHQWLRLDLLGVWLMGIPNGGRPYANLGQPNNLATLFCLGIVATVYLREAGTIGLTVTSLVTLLLSAGIAMTNSRTPLLAGVVLTGWILWSRKRSGLILSATHTITGAVVLFALWLSWPAISAGLELGSIDLTERAQSTERLIIWRQLIDAATQGPWFGYGWNQVSLAQIAVAADHPQSVLVEHSHNLILDLLLWNGVWIGGALTIVISGWFLRRLARTDNQESWFILSAVLAVGIHALLEFPLEYAYFLLPIGLLAGALDSHLTRKLALVSGWTLPALITVGTIVLSVIFVEYQAMEDDHRRMRYESAGLEPRTRTDEAAPVTFLTQLAEFTRFARTQAQEEMSPSELKRMEHVAHRYPYPPALFRYALALGLNHKYKGAEIELLRLKKLHPSARMDEAREGWATLTKRHPQLSNVVVP